MLPAVTTITVAPIATIDPAILRPVIGASLPRRGYHGVTLLISVETGFTARQIATGRRPFAVAVGDVNGDRRPDLAVVHYQVDGARDRVTILLGDGTGGFAPTSTATAEPSSSLPTRAAATLQSSRAAELGPGLPERFGAVPPVVCRNSLAAFLPGDRERWIAVQTGIAWGRTLTNMTRTAGLILVCTALIASACSSNGRGLETPAGGPTGPSGLDAGTIGNVKVTRVRVFIKDSQPQAFLQGEVGDGCNTLQPVAQQRAGNNVDITVTYRRQGDICTMIMQMLNQWVPLNGTFAPGEYVVRANDQTLRFRLVSGEGGLRVDPDPGPLPQPPYLPTR